MACSSETLSLKSPVTYSNANRLIARFELDARTSTRTFSPRATSWRATWLPKNPAAPVTNVVIARAILPRVHALPLQLALQLFLFQNATHRSHASNREARKRFAIAGLGLNLALPRFSHLIPPFPRLPSAGFRSIHPRRDSQYIAPVFGVRPTLYPRKSSSRRKPENPKAWPCVCFPSSPGSSRSAPRVNRARVPTRSVATSCRDAIRT